MSTSMSNHPNGIQHALLAGFLAPKGSTDWCSACGWEARCARCRAWQD